MTVAAPGPAAETCRLPQIAPVSGLVALCLGQVPMDAGPGDIQDLYQGLGSQAQVSGGFPRFHEGRLSLAQPQMASSAPPSGL